MDELDDFFKEIAETEKAVAATVVSDVEESAALELRPDGHAHGAVAEDKATAPSSAPQVAVSKGPVAAVPARSAPLVPRAAFVPAAALKAKVPAAAASMSSAQVSHAAPTISKPEEEDAEIDILKLLPFGAKAGSGVTNIKPVASGPKALPANSVFAAVPRQLVPKAATTAGAGSGAAVSSSGGAAVVGVIIKPPVIVAAAKPPQPAGSAIATSSSAASFYAPSQQTQTSGVPMARAGSAGASDGSSSSAGGSAGASGAAAMGGAGAAAAASAGEDSESAVGVGQKRKKPGLLRSCAGETWMDPTLAEWPEDDFRLFCGDLGNEVTDEILASAFRHYGSFAKAKVVRDSRSHKSKGYGFVSFMDPKDALDALTRMHGQYVGNRPVRLRRCNLAEKDAMEVRRKDAEREQMKRKVLGM